MHQKTDYISIGVIVGAHGIRGKLLVKPLTDEPQQFATLKVVYLNRDGNRVRLPVEKVRFVKNKIILKLAGINDRTSAEKLKGVLIEVEITALRQLSDDEYFIFSLIGLKVKDLSDNHIGVLSDVLSLPANDVYVVTDGNRELLIPAIKEVIKNIDLDQGVMIIDPIEGLLE